MLHTRKHQLILETTIFPTRTILHTCLDVIIIIYVQDIPTKLCSINSAKKAIKRHPINMTDADYDYILDEIERRQKIEF